MTELELLIFQLNMANDTIRNLERIRENVLNKNDTLNKKLKIAEEALIEQDNYFKEIENIINKYKLTESVIKVTSINPLDVQEILNIARKAKGVK